MDYLKTDAEQCKYSQNKLPELYERYNKNQEDALKIREKIDRHELIVDKFQMRDSE